MELEFAKTAHEMKNMLTLIQGTFQLIEDKHPETKEYEYWDQIREDIAHLNIFIDEAGKLDGAKTIIKQRNDLTKLLRELVKAYSPICRLKKVNLCLMMDDRSKEFAKDCSFDYAKLKMALSNLVKNAIEACEPQAAVDINLNYIEDRWANYVEISILNDGGFEGIEGRDIFEPFVTSKTDGTGLGLPIVKEVVIAHGGEIEVTSDGQRTCFAVRLPHAL